MPEKAARGVWRGRSVPAAAAPEFRNSCTPFRTIPSVTAARGGAFLATPLYCNLQLLLLKPRTPIRSHPVTPCLADTPHRPERIRRMAHITRPPSLPPNASSLPPSHHTQTLAPLGLRPFSGCHLRKPPDFSLSRTRSGGPSPNGDIAGCHAVLSTGRRPVYTSSSAVSTYFRLKVGESALALF